MNRRDRDWLPGETYYERKERRNAQMMEPLGKLLFAGVVVFFFAWLFSVSGCTVVAANTVPGQIGIEDDGTPIYVKEYWECGNVTYVCAAGTGPPATRALECALVADDTTWMRPDDCTNRIPLR